SARARFVERAEFCFEFRLAKPEIAQVAPDVFGKLWRSFRTQFAERFACTIHFCAEIRDLFCETLQLRVPSFNLLHSFRRAFAERNDFSDAATVFPFQGFEERNALLKGSELFRVEIELFGVSGK